MIQISPKRVHSIDTLRGLAIFFMIFAHYAQSWLNSENLITFSGFLFFPSYIGGPIFWIIVGISFSISAENRKPQKNFKIHVYKRAFILICFQFLLNLVIFNINQVWTYEILILIGLSQLVCYYLMKKSDLVKILIVIIIIMVVPLFRQFFGYQIELFTLFDPIWDFKKFLRVMISNGPFAIFPWISYMILGMMIGNALTQAKNEKIKAQQFCKKLIIYGAFLILIGVGFRIFNSPIINSYEEGLHVFLTTGIVMIMLSGLFWLEDIKKENFFQPLSLFGKISLTFLLGHHFINKYILFYIFNIMKNLSIYSFLSLITFICVIFWIFSKLWSIVEYKLSLDWIVRKLS